MKKFLIGLGIVVIAVAAFFSVHNAHKTPTSSGPLSGGTSRAQNPLGCSTQGQTATALATTSLSYMTPGTATTTITCNIATSGNGIELFDTAELMIQFTASSTSSKLNWQYQYSNGGNDWYTDNTINQYTASSTPQIVTIPTTYLWQFSSSTDVCYNTGITLATNSRACKAVPISVPTAFVRVVFTLPIGSTNGAVWAHITGKTQTDGM